MAGRLAVRSRAHLIAALHRGRDRAQFAARRGQLTVARGRHLADGGLQSHAASLLHELPVMLETIQHAELERITGAGFVGRTIALAKVGATTGAVGGATFGAIAGAAGLLGAGAVPGALIGGTVGAIGGATTAIVSSSLVGLLEAVK